MRIAALLAVALTAVGLATAFAGFERISYTVTIESASMDVGDQRSVALRIVDIDGGAGAWTIDVSYDPEVLSVVDCVPMANSVCDLTRGPDVFRVTGASAAGLMEDTTVARITFWCEEEGTSRLGLTWNGGGVPELIIDVQTDDGAVTCGALRGDVNADGEVNSIDAYWVLMLEDAVFGFPPPKWLLDAADVNNDGEISSVDATLILQYHAGLIDEL